MGDGRISLEAFFSEVQFWRNSHAELAATIAREVDEGRARVIRQHDAAIGSRSSGCGSQAE
jgi:hypothetical protein